MIAEFERMANDLDREIKTEQDRVGIQDPAHYAYPTYAKAARQRRDNLMGSADELKGQLEDAKAALAEAFEEFKKIEVLEEREQARDRATEMMREQAEMDRIALSRPPGLCPGLKPSVITTLKGRFLAKPAFSILCAYI